MVGTRNNPDSHNGQPDPLDTPIPSNAPTDENDGDNEQDPLADTPVPPVVPPPPIISPVVPPVDAATQQAVQLLSRTLTKTLATAMAQARPASIAVNLTKYPKAKDPSAFNGKNCKGLHNWIGENEICFRTAPNLYRSEVAKVMFAGSFLNGDAKSWFTDYFKDPANIPAFMEDWTLFTIELQRNFGLEDEIVAAEDDLCHLQMTDCDHTTYFTARFRAVSSNLQGMWDDRNLRNSYYSKLAPRLRMQFVSSGTPVPASLDPLISIAERFDRAYWADFALNHALNAQNPSNVRDKAKPVNDSNVATKSTAKSTTTAQTAAKPASKQHPTAFTPVCNNDHLNDQGKLTDAEHQHHIEAGACLYCGKSGHFAKDCDKKQDGRAKVAAAANPAALSNSTPATRASYTVYPSESDDLGNE
jgi:hypothetical protein